MNAVRDELSKEIGLHGKGDDLVVNHLSPNGKYIINCTDGIKVYEFKLESKKGDEAGPQDGSKEEKIILKEKTNWKVPIFTEGMDVLEIARRVRFEASNIIRFRTRDSKDILFLLL